MLQLISDFDLTAFNTFGIRAKSGWYAGLNSPDDLFSLFENHDYRNSEKLILGGGSNLLFTQDFRGMIIHPAFKKIEVTGKDESAILVKADAGLNWDEFVGHCVDQNWGGLENLTDIPGNVGAAPVQNIGAYGREISELVECVEGFNLETGIKLRFSKEDCNFGYRSSIFKNEWKGKALITSVTFRLTLSNHKLITHYGQVEEIIKKNGRPEISTVRKAIREIRASKLPDYKINGNAGSFFKNPVVDGNLVDKLKSDHPEIPVYAANDNNFKLSAAWLIDHAGCKSLTTGGAAVHQKQPLVLINMGNATGNDILTLSKLIQERVLQNFGVSLEPEVNII